MLSKAFHLFLCCYHFWLSITEDKASKAAQIKPKQAVWLLDENLGLCIEEACEGGEEDINEGILQDGGKPRREIFAARSTSVLGKEYWKDLWCSQQYKKGEILNINKHMQKVAVRAFQKWDFLYVNQMQE